MAGLKAETRGTLTHPCGAVEEVTIVTTYAVQHSSAHMPRYYIDGQKHFPSECDYCRRDVEARRLEHDEAERSTHR